MLFRHAAASQWQKYGEALNKGLGGDVSDVKVGDPAATRDPFVVSYKVSRGNFIDWSKKKLQIKLPLSYISPAAVADDVDEATDATDSQKPENFQLGPASENIYQLRLRLQSPSLSSATMALFSPLTKSMALLSLPSAN
jgi:hypothetical protein